MTNYNNYGYISIGTFISKNHILTVAQNINGYSKWIIGLNIFSNINNNNNEKSLLSFGQYIQSVTADIHPLFNAKNLLNNIGLITLKMNNFNTGESVFFLIFILKKKKKRCVIYI